MRGQHWEVSSRGPGGGRANEGGDCCLCFGTEVVERGLMNETGAWEQSACPTGGTVKVRVATALSLGRRLSQDSVWDTGWGCLWNVAEASFSGGGLGSAPPCRE